MQADSEQNATITNRANWAKLEEVWRKERGISRELIQSNIKGSYCSFILHTEGTITRVFCSYQPYNSSNVAKKLGRVQKRAVKSITWSETWNI